MDDEYADEEFEDYEGTPRHARPPTAGPSRTHPPAARRMHMGPCLAPPSLHRPSTVPRFPDEFEDDEEATPSPAAPRPSASVSPMVPVQIVNRPDPSALRAAHAPRPASARGPLAGPPQAGAVPVMQRPPPPPDVDRLGAAAYEPSPQRRFIAPTSHEARQQREVRAARLKALRSVVQLRDVDITLYDASPLTPYELHTRHKAGCARARTAARTARSRDQGPRTGPATLRPAPPRPAPPRPAPPCPVAVGVQAPGNSPPQHSVRPRAPCVGAG